MIAHAAPLTWETAVTSWRLSPWLALVVLLAVPYALGLRRVDAWPKWRAASYAAGLLALLLGVSGFLATYSDVLFSVHMAQHLTLIMAVPVLLVFGQPLQLWLQAAPEDRRERRRELLNARATGLVTHPVLTFVLYSAVLVATHLSPFLELRLQMPWLEHVEIVLYLLGGYLFVLPAVGAEPIRWQRMPHPLRVALLLVAMLPDTLVGVVLMIAARPVAPSYAVASAGWGPDLLQDQALAGAIMWFFGDAAMAAFALLTVRSWLRSSGSEAGFGSWLESARRQALTGRGPDDAGAERAADVDSDERALDEYNAMLARLHDPNRQRRSES